MTTVPQPLDHAWWIASRAAGVVALTALTLSVLCGLLMANGLPRRKGAGRALLALHESTSLAGLVAIGVHGVTLLGDPWLHPTLVQVAVPGTIAYRTLWTSLGIAGGWLAAALGLSFYLRRHIGAKLWRRAHKFTVVAWALAMGHTLGAGTDAGQRWLLVPLLAAGTAVVFLFLRRAVPGDPKRDRARTAARSIDIHAPQEAA